MKLFAGKWKSAAVVLLILAIYVPLAFGGFHDVNIYRTPSSYTSYRFGVDTVGATDEVYPFAHLNLTLVGIGGDSEQKPLGAEVLIFHSVAKEHILNDYCCSNATVGMVSACPPERNGRLAVDFDALDDLPQKMYYHWESDEIKEDLVDLKVNLNITGIWYVWMVNCASEVDSESHDIHMYGTLELKNTWGYLSTTIYGHLYIYGILAVAYVLLLIAFVVLIVTFRREMLGLQWAILATIIIGVVENVLWAADYGVYNNTGIIVHAINFVGATVSGLKWTSIRTLLLLVALGYCITKPTLHSQVKRGVITISILYFITAVLFEYIGALASMGETVDTFFEFIVMFGFVITSSIFIFWIGLAILRRIIQLKRDGQGVKLMLYTLFGWILGVIAILSILLFITEFIVVAAELRDYIPGFTFFFTGWWELVYFTATLCIAIMWRPMANNQLYAFAFEIDATETGEEEFKDVDTVALDQSRTKRHQRSQQEAQTSSPSEVRVEDDTEGDIGQEVSDDGTDPSGSTFEDDDDDEFIEEDLG